MVRRRYGVVRRFPDEPSRTRQEIFKAAVELFFAKGYEAATLRQLASKVGLQAGSLYNHVGSKQELLFTIMLGIVEDLLREMEATLEGRSDPIDRMRTAVHYHVSFHAKRMQEVFIGNSELRSLTAPNRNEVVRLRDRYERIFEGILDDGQQAGVFRVEDRRIGAYAILAMCTGVSSWYSPDGRMSVSELATLHANMVLRSLGVLEPTLLPPVEVLDPQPLLARESH